MASIHFITEDQSELTVNARSGESLMAAAVNNNVDGIEGECGGDMACGTCHVYVDPQWQERVPPAPSDEDEMLDILVDNRQPNSRLGCQLKISDDLDGLRVTVATQ